MSNEDQKGERIAKALARAGVGSRRDVERMIEEGRIWLDGKKLETAAVLVTSLKGITVDGEAIGLVSDTKLWRLHKRRGTLTTHKDPEGRRTVFDQLAKHIGRVIAVGRLDMNTEGLLLLTNDGELARYLELPSNELIRRYRVRVHGRVNEDALKALSDGVTIDGTHYGSIDARLERVQGTNAWLTIAIREGKNREVRRVMEHMGLVVNRLIRTHYGPFSLGTLNDGAVAQVPEKQLYEVLDGFFKGATQSIAAPEKKRDPSKWAKAKPKTKVRLGAKRRFRNRNDEGDARSTDRRGAKADPLSGRENSRRQNQSEKARDGKPASSRRSAKPEGTGARTGAKSGARSGARPGARPEGRPGARGPRKARDK
ncbi:pseudouridine synthase [Kordiimonas sp.]|uniref:pseudouridine synthase n=1 Tax=Kordiimonas sp. TaxID=1970157 RepID=UPI003A925039